MAMKLTRTLTLAIALPLLLLTPPASATQTGAAERAWKPFFSAFRAAVKKRDREALRKMMSRDFYFLSSGGDENGDADTRDEAFEFWEAPRIRGWEALDRVLSQGTAPNTAMRDPESDSRLPSRVAPPIANSRRAIERSEFEWYAVFEFRDGRWYCTVFNQCCD